MKGCIRQQQACLLMSNTQAYRATEVASHNSASDCWLIIADKIYDVTTFLADHPGGQKAILPHCGRDATDKFDVLHDRRAIRKCAPEAQIGILHPADRKNKKVRKVAQSRILRFLMGYPSLRPGDR
ncbi:hypothetical protein FOZ61_002690 [Perkinsus olseni]|uniref:Cytochrome b5 heme-binding domain-containing protein n=1 Tax=Perkinsus olseni TaxID=32597 RepID=A0A7J6LSB1_PEROL|nr:hypothetical protein FOZ61_002690 [Perkinsus olseni]